MAQQTLGQLFAGVTTSPSREFIADAIDYNKHTKLIFPCVGRWAVPTAAIARGAKPESIYCSDLSLFSSVIGYLADPSKSVKDLNVTIPSGYEFFVSDVTDEYDLAAGILLTLKYLSTPAKNVYMVEFLREMKSNYKTYREKLADSLKDQTDMLKGIHYEQGDVRGVMQEVLNENSENTFVYVNLPGYKGGYTKFYGVAENQMWTCALETHEFHPDEALPLLESLTECESTIYAYVHHGDKDVPEKWTKQVAIAIGRGRVDYLVTNQDNGARLTHGVKFDAKPNHWVVYNDEEITENSKIEFVDIDKATGLHYRDLFVHRLGQTKAESYGLMLIDGRVVTSFGLHRRHLFLGNSDYIGEVFGISVTSKRYARLGKLFMLMLTSGETRKWLLNEYPAMHLTPPKGISTASPALHHEGKTDRGVMKLVRRVPLPNGGFQLLYQGDFRDDTYADVLKNWLEKFGNISR